MNLRIPGPTPVPAHILAAMAEPMINHRGPEFKDILLRVTGRLKQVFETDGEMFVLTASGTGALEAAVVNTLSPGDGVLCATTGVFGDRFGEMAAAFGARVEYLRFREGTAVDVDELRRSLRKAPATRAVLVTHNETSTGVTNDLEAIAGVVRGESDALLLVDGISSVSSIPLPTDAWGCDVVTSASQKGWMMPPGLAFISFSERAQQAQSRAAMPRYYFDLAEYRRYLQIGQPPYTPSVSAMFALDVVLATMLDEGMGAIFERHATIGSLTRELVKGLGLSLLPDERVASNTVTAVKVPAGVDAGKLLGIVRQEHDVVLAGGQQKLAGKIFRIGHMGFCTEADIRATTTALAAALARLGFRSAAVGV